MLLAMAGHKIVTKDTFLANEGSRNQSCDSKISLKINLHFQIDEINRTETIGLEVAIWIMVLFINN